MKIKTCLFLLAIHSGTACDVLAPDGRVRFYISNETGCSVSRVTIERWEQENNTYQDLGPLNSYEVVRRDLKPGEYTIRIYFGGHSKAVDVTLKDRPYLLVIKSVEGEG